MPYKTEKLKLDDEFFDKRIKMIACKKEMALYWRMQGWSYGKIAKMFSVSKKTIMLLLDKEIKQRHQEYSKDAWKKYYSKEKHKEFIKTHRKHKHKLLKDVE